MDAGKLEKAGGERIARGGEEVKRERAPRWWVETRDLVATELFAMDDTEKIGFLDEAGREAERGARRTRRRRLAAWLAVPMILVVVYAVWALTANLQDASGWTHRFTYGTNEIREEGRQEYLLGVGKADITG